MQQHGCREIAGEEKIGVPVITFLELNTPDVFTLSSVLHVEYLLNNDVKGRTAQKWHNWPPPLIPSVRFC